MEKKIVIDVKGMHCAACSSRIEKVVGGMDGVNEASVNLADDTLKLTYVEPVSNFDLIAERVNELGFELIPRQVAKQGELKVKISGMHCASCSSRIEKVVSSIAGVTFASVNLASETATFKFDESSGKSRNITQAIAELGFGVDVIENELERYNQKEKETLKNLRLMRQNLLRKFVLLMPLLLLSMGEMIGLKLPEIISPMHSPLRFASLQLLFTIPIMWLGRNFYLIGIPALMRRSPNMDSLIAIGTGAAFIYSLWNYVEMLAGIDPVAKSMDLYFESVGVLITLVSLGKYMENRSKYHTSDAIRQMMNLAPKTAELLVEGEQRTIPIEEIEVDDILVVRSGESIPTDGKIIKGESTIDESLMTGESLPVFKKHGDSVYGGTVNSSNTIQIIVEQTATNTMLSKIIRMVQEAQGSKAPIAKIADRVSYYFVPVVIVLAILTGLSWFYFSDIGFSQSLRFFIAVMVIACPCAMGLATPISIMVGTGRGAQLGILVKNGETLERMEKVSAVIFDKTGTITQGKPEVVNIEYSNMQPDNTYIELVASAEQSSEHPLAKAIVRYAQQENISLQQPDTFQSFPGRGIIAKFGITEVIVGNDELFCEKSISTSKFDNKVRLYSNEGKTVLFFALDRICEGIVVISDSMKKEAVQAVKQLKDAGREVIMLTGDNKQTAETIARLAGITEVIAEVLPDKKAEVVKQYQSAYDCVAMVGDGINDAPALAQADVGIAMGTGIDIAIESGDVVVMNGNLDGVVAALHLSRAVMKNIRQNLFWAFGYNVLGIPVAAGLLFLFGGPALNPMFAGAAMAMSSVSVVFNALRLRFFNV